MQRVMIIGCPGAGKTTLSLEISQKLKLPLHHLDLLMWRPNWTPMPYQEFLEAQDKILAGDSWVVDGNFTKSIPVRMNRADTIIFLDVPKMTCLWRLIKRYFKYFRKNRPDMGGENKEALKLKQLKFVLTYPRAQVYEMLKNIPAGKQLFILKSKKDRRHLLDSLRS